MAVSHRGYIYGTFLLSCLSIALLSVGIATQGWVSGTARFQNTPSADSIEFGLFVGSHIRNVAGTFTSTTYLTCLLENNICAYSCRPTSEVRKWELNSYYNGIMLQATCDASNSTTGTTPKEIVWFNGGVYVSLLTFLGLALFFALLSALFGIYNGSKSPIEPIWGVFGLYIWNGLSALSTLIAIMLWGIHYETNMKNNFTYTYMFLDYNSFDSSVGYSYWLTFSSIICHLVNEALLGKRLWLIRTEPPPPTINIEKTDDTLFLF